MMTRLALLALVLLLFLLGAIADADKGMYE